MIFAHDQLPLERPQQSHSTRARHPYEATSSLTGGLVTGAAGLLTHADPGTRARILRQFQGTAGNASVQRMLRGVALRRPSAYSWPRTCGNRPRHPHFPGQEHVSPLRHTYVKIAVDTQG